jgi:two-component system sensor histidine kinase DegS
MDKSLPQLAEELAADQAMLERELAEIELLLRQTTTEAERHEARRVQAEDRVRILERGDPDGELPDARTALITQTRRGTLMQAQLDVLGGKQRALQRYRDRLAQIVPVMRDAPSGGGVESAPVPAHPASEDLAAQEQLRRDIARQMHDGPAQSIANIALHAQVVQRLFERQPKQAQAELVELVRMVEQALAATKDFIFDVRPMVLDDLGLMPTLRRTALDRGSRAGVEIDLDSQGTERRLPQDMESGVFRLIDDTINGYLALRPSRVAVRLDWGEHRLGVMIRAGWIAESRATPATTVGRLPDDLPPALRQMIEQTRDQDRQVASGTHALPQDLLMDLGDRARVMGVSLQVSNDGTTVELSVRTT